MSLYNNKKAKRFNSKYFQPKTNGVNAFMQGWAYGTNWLCSPVSLMVEVVNLMRMYEAAEH